MVEYEMYTASLPNPVAQHLDTWGPITGSALPTVYTLRGKMEKKKKKEKEIVVQIIQVKFEKFQLMTLLPSYGDFLRNIPSSHPAKPFPVSVRFSKGLNLRESKIVA